MTDAQMTKSIFEYRKPQQVGELVQLFDGKSEVRIEEYGPNYENRILYDDRAENLHYTMHGYASALCERFLDYDHYEFPFETLEIDRYLIIVKPEAGASAP